MFAAVLIGARFHDWWWVFGVFVANVLWTAILVRYWAGEPAELGSGQAVMGIIFWFVFFLLPSTLPAAAAGVWWGKRRERGHRGAPHAVLRGRAAPPVPPG
jgi:hypothetical protein